MFGYVLINKETLPAEALARYEAFYCGLCRTLRSRHGQAGRMTLSYEMTFLLVLLSALYEPEETRGEATCAMHPLKPRPYIQNALSDYAADMNIALAYHKGEDDRIDEGGLLSRVQVGRLSGPYARVTALYPEACRTLEASMEAVRALEKRNPPDVDALTNETALMLGAVFAYGDDIWSADLRAMGGALGRFIYLMDAWEDLPDDTKKGRFNPLASYAEHEDYDSLCEEALSLLIAECAQIFETLPLVQDMDILRNILYSGVWTRYEAVKQKRAGQKEKA